MTDLLTRIWNKPNVTMQEIRPFVADRRLTEPFAIMASGEFGEFGESFGEYETYPIELSEVFYYNGF